MKDLEDPAVQCRWLAVSGGRVVLNRVFELIQRILLAYTPGPKSAEGPYWYQMVELR